IHRASMEETRVSAQRLSGALGGISAAAGAMGTAMIAGSVFGVMGLKNLLDTAIAYQKQTALTSTQVDGFKYSMRQLEDVGLRVANTVGVPFEDIQVALFDIFSSMEVNITQAEQLLTVFSKAAVAGQTSIQAASRATIGILNAFHLPLSSVNHLMDLQFQLVQEGVGTYEEWAQRIGLVTPSAARAGQSVEMMTSALAAATRLGVSAARAGTSVARAFDALSHPTAVKNIEQMGIKVTDAKGKFRPFIDVLQDLRTAILKLPEAKRAAKIVEIFKGAGGTIEARRFIQNMLTKPGNIELWRSIFDEMTKSSGSFEEAYGIMADTAATKSELLSNKWKSLKVAAGEALIPTFLKIVDWLGRLIDKFNALSPETQAFIIKMAAAAIVLSGLLGIILLVVGAFAAFGAAAAVVGAPLLIAGAAVAVLSIGLLALIGLLAVMATKSQGFRDKVTGAFKAIKDFWNNDLIPIFNKVKKAFEEKLLPALKKLKDKFEQDVLPILERFWSVLMEKIKPAIIEIANTIKDYLIASYEQLKDIIETQIIPMFEELKRFYEEHKQSIDLLTGALVFMIKMLVKFLAIIGGVVLAILLGPVAKAFLGFISLLIWLAELFVLLGETINSWAHAVPHAIEAAVKAIVDWVVRVWGSFQTFKTNLGIFFMGVIANMKNAGKDMIQGLIDGIKSMVGSAVSTVENLGTSVVTKLKQVLGIHSPSKVFMEMGKQSMKGFILGFTGAQPAMRAQITNTTAGLTGAVATGRGGNGNGVNQNFYITTQEIEPRRHSAELGWLLTGSM
ncbi:MAG TPA: phage tail tape measure protein, partial [Allocoleopsis sp.]